MVVAKTAGKNVAIKSEKLAESVFAGQFVIQTRQVAAEGLSYDDADLNIFNQNNRQD